MKFIKKNMSVCLIGVALLFFSGCSAEMFNTDIAKTVDRSLSMPEQYSITYVIEDASGMSHTVRKSVDSEGNTYFQSGIDEFLFIKDSEHYALYKKDKNGQFAAQNAYAIYTPTYVDSVTSEFLDYVERSKQQFMPSIEEIGKQEVLGRTCLVYGIKLGSENTAVSYSFFVDKETGICLGWDESKIIAGNEYTADGEVFTCTEFITENVPSLRALIGE